MGEDIDKDFSYKDIKISGGPEIETNSDILLLYKMSLSLKQLNNGNYIESTYSPDIPIAVKVNRETLLEGLYQGLLGMRGGGAVRLITIPSSMGYSEYGYNNIPPNATLFIEVCTVAVDEPMTK